MLYVPEPTAKHIPDGDAVFATAWQTAEYVLDYPQEKGAKFYLIQSYEVWSGPKERVDATWRAPFKKVVIAQWLYDKGVELGALASGMIHIPNGMDHTRYRVLLPIDNRPPRVAMMHSRLSVKGGQDGLHAIGSAKARVPHLEALVFGTDARPRGLPGWIRYFRDPPQSDLIRNIYNESSIYLCPSLTEGWALPPAEAMACGCALVSTDIGGGHDYAEHEATALLSPAGNPQALADSIVRAVSDDDLRVRLAKAGNARIQEFTWERSTDLLEGFLSRD
jgi:glycosyltransferase involved in cell wall biosynthesis